MARRPWSLSSRRAVCAWSLRSGATSARRGQPLMVSNATTSTSRAREGEIVNVFAHFLAWHHVLEVCLSTGSCHAHSEAHRRYLACGEQCVATPLRSQDSSSGHPQLRRAARLCADAFGSGLTPHQPSDHTIIDQHHVPRLGQALAFGVPCPPSSSPGVGNVLGCPGQSMGWLMRFPAASIAALRGAIHCGDSSTTRRSVF
jgi:hypothetical protein